MRMIDMTGSLFGVLSILSMFCYWKYKIGFRIILQKNRIIILRYCYSIYQNVISKCLYIKCDDYRKNFILKTHCDILMTILIIL